VIRRFVRSIVVFKYQSTKAPPPITTTTTTISTYKNIAVAKVEDVHKR